MDDISEKINSILSDPSAMEQIKALGGMLGFDQNGSKPPPAQKPSNALSGINMPDPASMSMIMKFAPLLGRINEENESTRLLAALRPFLSEKRRPRVDQAIRMLSIMRMLPMLREFF